MNILRFLSPLRLSYLILHYGLYAAIVHASAILLYANISPSLPPYICFLRYFPMIEHSIVAFICVLLGALLCFYIHIKEKQN